VMDGLVAELTEGANAEMTVVEEHGGAVEAVPYTLRDVLSALFSFWPIPKKGRAAESSTNSIN